MKTQIWISRKDKIYRWLPEKEDAVYEKQQKHGDDSLQLIGEVNVGKVSL